LLWPPVAKVWWCAPPLPEELGRAQVVGLARVAVAHGGRDQLGYVRVSVQAGEVVLLPRQGIQHGVVVEAVREDQPAPLAGVGVEVRQHLGHASVLGGEHRLHLRVVQLREDTLGPGAGLEAHLEGDAIARVAVGVAQAGHRLVEHVPGDPQAVEIERSGPDVALAICAKHSRAPFWAKRKPSPCLSWTSFSSAHDVVGALLEPRLAGGRPHEAHRREVMAGDVAGEVVAVAVPAAVRLCFRGQARALAVEREHPIGLEREQVLGVQVLGALERPAGDPHGRERQGPRDIRACRRDLGRVDGAARQEGDATEESACDVPESNGADVKAHPFPLTTTRRVRSNAPCAL
jgi:hypothetical protein